MGILIRRYQEGDISDMLDRVEEFLSHDRFQGFENHFKGIDFDREKLYKILRSNVKNIRFFANVVLDDEHGIVGGLCGEVTEYLFSRDVLATDHILYFQPDRCNLSALNELIDLYTQWAENRGVREVQLRSSTQFKQDGFTALMKRKGYEQFELGFSRRFR